MTSACVRIRQNKKHQVKQLIGSGIGIPSAPIFRGTIRKVDKDFQERKYRTQSKLPIYSAKEVQRLGSPFHILIIQTLTENGYDAVVNEIQLIFRKEEMEMIRNRDYEERPLRSQQEDFTQIAETLKFCEDLIRANKIEHAVSLRQDLAVKMMNSHIWLARHLLTICLQLTEHVTFQKERFQAETHCLLAFLYRQQSQKNFKIKVEDALAHLSEARELSEGEPWHFKANVLMLNVPTSIDLHGLRKEEVYVDVHIMPLYMVASLLEHEMLLKLANEILLSQQNPTNEEVLRAIQYAEGALQLTLEVREPEAMNTALIRFGSLLRDYGDFEGAMDYFDETCLHAEIKADKTTESIGFHGLGTCFNSKREPLNALEMFALQNEMGDGILDLQAEAYREIGHILLTEGQLPEARECLLQSHINFVSAKEKYTSTPQHWLDNAWGLAAVGLGQRTWGQLAGLIRRNSSSALKSIAHFKNLRISLPRLKRPDYDVKLIRDEYETPSKTETDQDPHVINFVESDHAMMMSEEEEEEETHSEIFQKENIHHHHHHHHFPDVRKKKISFNFGGSNWLGHQNRRGEGSMKTALSEGGSSEPSGDNNSYSGSSTLSPQTIFDSEMIYESDLGRKSNTKFMDIVSKSKHGSEKSDVRSTNSTNFSTVVNKAIPRLAQVTEKWKSASTLLERYSSIASSGRNKIPEHLLLSKPQSGASIAFDGGSTNSK